MIPREEITCTQCGTSVKLKNPSMGKENLCVCPECGANYKYICEEPIMDGGPDEWA
jgi:lysine biosynthesis protein LysW